MVERKTEKKGANIYNRRGEYDTKEREPIKKKIENKNTLMRQEMSSESLQIGVSERLAIWECKRQIRQSLSLSSPFFHY